MSDPPFYDEKQKTNIISERAKTARLPRNIYDELNRRFDNGWDGRAIGGMPQFGASGQDLKSIGLINRAWKLNPIKPG